MIMCAEYVSIYLFISLSLIYLHIFTRIENVSGASHNSLCVTCQKFCVCCHKIASGSNQEKHNDMCLHVNMSNQCSQQCVTIVNMFFCCEKNAQGGSASCHG